MCYIWSLPFGKRIMGKYKPAGSRKVEIKKSNARAIPCLILIVVAIGLISLLFYELLKGGN